MLYRIFLILFSWILLTSSAYGSSLENRLETFPQWNQKPPTRIAKGDLYYPVWMSGNWQVTSTLIEQVAPLAPEVSSPGFDNNQQYLNQDLNFQVSFVESVSRADQPSAKFKLDPLARLTHNLDQKQLAKPIIADRVFNGTSIAKTYLGEDQVVAVKVDPLNPNKQITFLAGNRQLISKVMGRTSEQPETDRFLTSELASQVFKSPDSIYLNEVETTSDYRLLSPDQVTARQMTAIYLSPQDPNYFKAGSQPIALYLYRLNLQKLS